MSTIYNQSLERTSVISQTPQCDIPPIKTWDSHTDRRIQTLHPLIRTKAATFINRVESELGVQLRVTEALRPPETQEKYLKEGKTNAAPWQSYHNYGLAIDVLEIRSGAIYEHTNWPAVAEIAKQEGFDWSGQWKSFSEQGHFEMPFGHHWSELKNRYQTGLRDGPYVFIDTSNSRDCHH